MIHVTCKCMVDLIRRRTERREALGTRLDQTFNHRTRSRSQTILEVLTLISGWKH